MPANSEIPRRQRALTVVAAPAGTAYGFGLLAALVAFPAIGTAILLPATIAGAAISLIDARGRLALALEFTIYPIAVIPFFGWLGATEPIYLCLPLTVTVAASSTMYAGARLSAAIPWAVFAAWICAAATYLPGPPSPAEIVLVSFGAATALLHSAAIAWTPRAPIKTADAIVCSYSGNSAHLAEGFARGMEEAGCRVTRHRFHHHKSFKAALDGDALVLSFPVIGWKPPWPLFNYLIFGLPRGHGKPAYILYSCAGGPENTAVITGVLLMLKGYRVAGRLWDLYPMNVPTIRLMPFFIASRIDRLVYPGPRAEARHRAAGHTFASGRVSGMPFIAWPFFLFVAGPITDNWLTDRIYRNHVFRHRCTGCGLCARFCPVGRLRMAGKYPRHRGTCALCFGCINICPTRAMQFWFLSEYGAPYRPLSPELVVRKGPEVSEDE